MKGLSPHTRAVYEKSGGLLSPEALGDPVVFVNRHGKALCHLQDDIWPLPGSEERLHWTTDDDSLRPLLAQAKILFLHVLFHPALLDLSPGTLRHYQYALRSLAAAAKECDCESLGPFFSDSFASNKMLNKVLKSTGRMAMIQAGTGLFNALIRIDEKTLGFRVRRGETYNRLAAARRELHLSRNQHPVIPWDIYKFLIRESVFLLKRYRERLRHPAWVAAINLYFVQMEGASYAQKHRALENQLENEYPDFEISKPRMLPILKELGDMQEMARIGIIIFTGCRHAETQELQPKKAKYQQNGAYLIEGESTKLGHGDVSWVTNADGALALDLALEIRKTIATGLAIDAASSIPTVFPSLRCFPKFISKPRSLVQSKDKNSLDQPTGLAGLFNRLGVSVPTISSPSHKFLSDLCQDSNLDIDSYKIGEIFPIKPHHFRRALAYFAMRSGNVEIGALKRQLKHLALAMTEYYSSGALGMDEEGRHSLSDLIEKERYADIDERLRMHLSNAQQLAGPMGTLMRRNVDKETAVDRVRVIEANRKQILRRVRSGEVSYTQTPLGACMSVEPCLSRSRAELSACLRCPSAVVEHPKAQQVYEVLRSADNPFFSAQAEHFSHFLMTSDGSLADQSPDEGD